MKRIKEIEQFSNVWNHPIFQKNPLDIITEHINNR